MTEQHEHDANRTHRQTLTVSDRIALGIARSAGTMAFFWLCCILALLPLVYPASMAVVQFVSSGFLQLVLLPVIMVAQSLSSRHAEHRAEALYRFSGETRLRLDALAANQRRIMLALNLPETPDRETTNTRIRHAARDKPR